MAASSVGTEYKVGPLCHTGNREITQRMGRFTLPAKMSILFPVSSRQAFVYPGSTDPGSTRDVTFAITLAPSLWHLHSSSFHIRHSSFHLRHSCLFTPTACHPAASPHFILRAIFQTLSRLFQLNMGTTDSDSTVMNGVSDPVSLEGYLVRGLGHGHRMFYLCVEH